MIAAWFVTLAITVIGVGAVMAALGLGIWFGRNGPRGTCGSGPCGDCAGLGSAHCTRREENA